MTRTKYGNRRLFGANDIFLGKEYVAHFKVARWVNASAVLSAQSCGGTGEAAIKVLAHFKVARWVNASVLLFAQSCGGTGEAAQKVLAHFKVARWVNASAVLSAQSYGGTGEASIKVLAHFFQEVHPPPLKKIAKPLTSYIKSLIRAIKRSAY